VTFLRWGAVFAGVIALAYVALIVAANLGFDFVLPQWRSCAHPVAERDVEAMYRAKVGENPLRPLIIIDDGKYLHVSQSVTPRFSSHGNTETVTVTEGSGQPEMQIDKCSGEVRVSYSR
jgi:hypothetical protein